MRSFEVSLRRSRTFKSLAISALGIGAFLGATTAQALVITPHFDSSITGNANAAQIEATINQAIAAFQAKLTDNVTVNISFVNTTSGLGGSNTFFVTVPYATYRAALVTDKKSADDTLALSHLPSQTNDPVLNNNNGVDLTTANARAVGLSASTSSDSTIFLNTSICNLDHSVVTDPNKYDLFAVASHEMDETLGVGGPGTNVGAGSNHIAEEDLFRYDGSGNHSFTTSATAHAYFSIDGTTLIDEFNQSGNGDYADWIQHPSNPEVQDWAGTPGHITNLGESELRALDVVGWDRAAVPEPASMTALGLGLLAVLRRRKKK